VLAVVSATREGIAIALRHGYPRTRDNVCEWLATDCIENIFSVEACAGIWWPDMGLIRRLIYYT